MRRRIAVQLIVLLWSCVAAGQLRIDLPKTSFKPEEKIQAKVANLSKEVVTYCVEFGQSSPFGGAYESTPIPFYVERRTNGRWGALLLGPDVGTSRHPAELGPGKSEEFPFRLVKTGEVRLVLRYWPGEHNDACSDPKKGRKTVRSWVFSVLVRNP